MTNEILIGIGGLVLSILTYLAGIWQTERRHWKGDREVRVRRVFDKYMDFRRTNYTGGYDGLQKAGIATLVSNDEFANSLSSSSRTARRIRLVLAMRLYSRTWIF